MLRILIPRYLACSELVFLLPLIKTKALTATFKLSCCSCLAPWHSLVYPRGLAIVVMRLSVLPAQPVWVWASRQCCEPWQGLLTWAANTEHTVCPGSHRGRHQCLDEVCSPPRGIFWGEEGWCRCWTQCAAPTPTLSPGFRKWLDKLRFSDKMIEAGRR